MDKKLFLVICILAISITTYSQNEGNEFRESCTSIMVGKKASTDGSVMTSHTCDGSYRSWIEIVPAQKHKKGDVTKILQGALYTENPEEITKIQLTGKNSEDSIYFDNRMKIKGEIPEAEETYAFLNSAYPFMNEKNLAMGETTVTGRKELVNENGLFYIEELQRIALQRCTTAREAILLMGEMVKKYGYADAGECLTVADKNEVWHFEVFGEGADKIGGVWAAQRIPDDHVGVSANISRIGELNLADKNNFMASENVFEVAKKLGYWDGKSTFKFWKAYSGNKPFGIRDWFVLSSLAPSLNLSMDDEELPFSVKPEKLVSPRDVLKFFRETYEGTKYDVTKNILIKRRKADSKETELVKSPYANPWLTADMGSTLNTIKDSTVVRIRQIAVPQCAYEHVIQIRGWLPDEIACVAYFGTDNPAQSPRVPIYAKTMQTPKLFQVSGHKRYTTDAAAWVYRRANKLASVRWQESRVKLEKLRDNFEDKLFNEQSKIDSQALEIFKTQGKQAGQEFLTKYFSDFAEETLNAWWKLGDELWFTFLRGI
jgi:dipeptidase